MWVILCDLGQACDLIDGPFPMDLYTPGYAVRFFCFCFFFKCTLKTCVSRASTHNLYACINGFIDADTIIFNDFVNLRYQNRCYFFCHDLTDCCGLLVRCYVVYRKLWKRTFRLHEFLCFPLPPTNYYQIGKALLAVQVNTNARNIFFNWKAGSRLEGQRCTSKLRYSEVSLPYDEKQCSCSEQYATIVTHHITKCLLHRTSEINSISFKIRI